MISQSCRNWFCAATTLTAAGLLACGGPTAVPVGPTTTSSVRVSATGTALSTDTGIDINLTPGATSTHTSASTTPISASDGGNCGITTNTINQQTVDLLLVLDRSGSMDYDIASGNTCSGRTAPANCTARWPTMTASLKQVLTAATPGVQWGLKLFTSPKGSTCTVNAGADVNVGPNTAATIQTTIAGTSPGNQTPTTAAIKAAVAYFDTVKDGFPHFILLATDGQPNCDPGTSSEITATSVANTVAALTAAASAGVKTYVIGIGPESGNLDSFAAAGGTSKYYPALSPDQLTAALSSIVGKVASCTFNLGKTPPDPSNIAIEFDGNSSLRAPRDTTHTNGWDYTSSANTTIQLFGTWCDKVTNGTYTSAKVLMGCPGGEKIFQ